MMHTQLIFKAPENDSPGKWDFPTEEPFTIIDMYLSHEEHLQFKSADVDQLVTKVNKNYTYICEEENGDLFTLTSDDLEEWMSYGVVKTHRPKTDCSMRVK